MKRIDLEHIIRASGEISNDDEIIVIGSQAILGSFPDAPKELLVSTEADVYPRNRPDRADLIDGSIGEGSPFHRLTGTTRRESTKAPRFSRGAGEIV